jgi:hypothetical protein
MSGGALNIYWLRSPSALSKNVLLYGAKLQLAIKTLADYFAQKIQDEARRNARWEDRTGNARSGLFAIAEQAATDLTTIYLSHGHTVYYGVFLELCNGGKYAIILPTIQRNLPEIERQLKRLLA